jgi:hypothetical protein
LNLFGISSVYGTEGRLPAKQPNNNMKRKITLMATLLTLTGAAIYTNTTALAQSTPPPATQTPATPVHERHPAIRNAIRALEKAKVDLKNADHDFGGHREAALKECDAAIEQLKLALQYDKQ